MEDVRLQTWIEKAYADRLDGVLTVDEYREKVAGWRARFLEVQNEIRAHQSSDHGFMDQADRILELAQRAHELYLRQENNHERRKRVDSIVSKVVISGRMAGCPCPRCRVQSRPAA
ncbi:MAG: hypothetical protein HC802_02455 [Caldilineaceae bacterium]|nr:hypothetical protein [Caldilineaceae bacterium]